MKEIIISVVVYLMGVGGLILSLRLKRFDKWHEAMGWYLFCVSYALICWKLFGK